MPTPVCCNHIQARIDYVSAQLLRVKALSRFATSSRKEAFDDQAIRMQEKLIVLKELLEQHKLLQRHHLGSFVEET